MALKIEITDERGVKTRYHKIQTFGYNGRNLVVVMASYVNQTTRDSEQKMDENNKLATQYDDNLNALRGELDALSSKLLPTGEGDPEVIERIKELSQSVNDLASNPDRPQHQSSVSKYYDQYTVDLPYFEPLSLEAIYNRLAIDGRYAGAETI